MVNEWINEGLHPITGIKEDFRRMITIQQKRVHNYNYQFDVNLPDYA